jgi:hypothetical protein
MRGSVVLLVVLAGCEGSRVGIPTTGESGSGGEILECRRDDECVAAGVKCCDCPEFAVPMSDASHRACDGVPCPSKHCPHNVRAACDDGRCVLTCVPMACEQSCLFGYAADRSGCLTCECTLPVLTGCILPSDCVEVRADCCGCARGGRDTAVLRDDASDYEAGLRCPATPQCPVANTCEAADEPQCIRGRCVLAVAERLPSNACGRIDLPPCGDGQVCVVNGHNLRVNKEGVGLCMPRGDAVWDPPSR